MADVKSSRRLLVAIALGVAIIGLLLFVLSEDAGRLLRWAQASLPEIERLIKSSGHWGVAASIGLMALHSFVPFPAEVVAIANGRIYGPLWGTLITWVGAMLGAFLSFGLTRIVGRPFVHHVLTKRSLQRVDDWVATYGAGAVFFSRFIPVIAFNLINYAAGLTKISWWTFTWMTGVGILPLTTLMVVMGHRMETMSWQGWLLLLGAGLGVSLLAHRFMQRSGGPGDRQN